jgi:hypothetical protein
MLRTRFGVVAAAVMGLVAATSGVSSGAAVPNIYGPPPPPPPPSPPPPPPAAAIAAASAGKAMNVVVNVNGQLSSLVNQVMASGSSPKAAYSQKNSVPTYTNTTAFKGGLTLTGNARTLTSIANATATSASGQRTANASATIGALTLTVKNGSAVLMTLTGTRLSSNASFLATSAGAHTPSGSVSIGGVTINSTAFGAKNVKFSGAAAANQVLFKTLDGTVVIYANRQTITTTAGGKPSQITVDGISVQLTKFKNGGKSITGDFEIATSIAN